jgi:inorganic triphosphatase YgiF
MVSEFNPSYYSVMNHEIELKLRLNTSELCLLERALASHQFINEPTLKLLNRYFDTPDMGLSRRGAALRIRQQGIIDAQGDLHDERIIQTLKTRGTSSAGLHQRMEWDWPLTEVELDLGLIQTSDAQNHLSTALELNRITPLFTTDFQRQVWMFEQGETLIELVLDQGKVSTLEHNVELLELELELKQGKPDVLFQLAQQLAEQCPLLMSDISKAERGYGLLALSPEYQQIEKDWSGKVPSFDPQQDVISCFKTFFAYQLSSCQRALEYSIWDGQPELHQTAELQLILLQQLLSIFTQIDCLPEVQLLQRQIQHGIQSKFDVSLLWGQLSIKCGRWLFSLEADSAKFEMTAEEHNSMRLHVEQLLQGMNQ